MAATFPSHSTKAAAFSSQSNSLSFACCCPCEEHRGGVRRGSCCSAQKAARCWEGEGNQINSADFFSGWVRRVGLMVLRAGSCFWEEQSAFSHEDCVVISPHSPPQVMANVHCHSKRIQMLFFPSCWETQYWLCIYEAHYVRTCPWTACWAAISIKYVTFSSWELINILRSPFWRCITSFQNVWYPVPDMSADLYKLWIEM